MTLISINWFKANYMKLNNDKCHLIVAGHKYEHMWARIGESRIWEKHKVKLLGVHIDNKLSFKYHVSQICQKAGRKISALARVRHLFSLERKRILMKSFIESQFSYCPLVWMFHDRTLKRKINRLHERALRIVYDNNETTTFEELLKRDQSYTVHQRNIQTLAIEMFKCKNGLAPSIMKEIFVEKRDTGHFLRSRDDFENINIKKVHTGENTLTYLGGKIWNLIPNDFKELNSVESFNSKIRKWEQDKCPCHLCRDFVYKCGYI